MKYLSKFNESSSYFPMTDRDLEIIENCFLEYIDQTTQGEYIPSRVIHGKTADYVIFRFEIPQPQQHELLASWSDRSEGELSDYILRMHFVWNWVSGFIEQLSGDIKRCESYGFQCMFHLDFMASFRFYLTVHHKGYYDENREVNLIHSPQVYVRHKSKALDFDDALNYAHLKLAEY